MIALGNACSRRYYPTATAQFATKCTTRLRCSGEACCAGHHASPYCTTSTTPTLFTPLQAIYTRPYGAAAMFRTVPPPDGIAARANSSVFGSNRTMVFGFTPDSLYHTMPSGVMVIPYGADPLPLGDGHIFTAPVTGSSRPKFPPL